MDIVQSLILASLIAVLAIVLLSIAYEKKKFGQASTVYAFLGILSFIVLSLMLFLYSSGFPWLVILLDYILALAVVLVVYFSIMRG